MGFQEQLQSILARLPESRQTLLFSATLPKMLVDFARAGLHDPTLLRLDVDSKISDRLQVFLSSAFCCVITWAKEYLIIQMHDWSLPP